MFDTIGYWSEVKLDIVKEYAAAYSKIMTAQKVPFRHFYIDAFAGAGVNISKRSGEFVLGSPLNALLVVPPFSAYYLIDIDGRKIEFLLDNIKDYNNVSVYQGDCNILLLEQIFPLVKFEDYCRALCLLDPYGLHLNWEVMETAGKLGTIEMFLNFPSLDMNRNALWRNPDAADPDQVARMDRFWGDNSWRKAVYDTRNLFEFENKIDDANAAVVKAFQNRLKKVAGFSYVPEPIPMRNSIGATVYYLFFASQKPAAAEIVKDIFNKYRDYE